MQFLNPFLSTILLLSSAITPVYAQGGFRPLAVRQAAAGGGAAAATTQATQDATVTDAASHVVVDGTTTVEYVVFTQTFATTALGTWAFGSVTSSGSIGLGTIEGTVGSVKSKRALPTAGFAS